MTNTTDFASRAGAFAPGAVGGTARGAALLGGAALAFAGFRRGGTVGWTLAAAGGALALAGLTGETAIRQAGQVLPPPRREADERSPRTVATVTIFRPASEVYRLVRDFAMWPHFMEHLESVEVQDEIRSTWTAKGPAGTRVTWESEVVEDRPDRSIAWRSVAGSRAPNSGWVEMREAPGGRGTELRAEMRYEVPGGRLGEVVAAFAGRSPAEELRNGLRRLKQLIETGEVPTTEGQPHGTRSRWSIAQ
ncbi:MAG TPA: SRPBCC family protein [Azospirillaceae bacterium]|nr:SRPBCC family protein [Azospirillaceae bacterium]